MAEVASPDDAVRQMPALLRRMELARPSADTKIKEILTNTPARTWSFPVSQRAPAARQRADPGCRALRHHGHRRNLARFTGEAGNAAGSQLTRIRLPFSNGAGRRAPCTLTARTTTPVSPGRLGIRLLTRADRTSRDAESLIRPDWTQHPQADTGHEQNALYRTRDNINPAS